MRTMARYPDGYFYLAVPDVPYAIGVGKMPYLSEQGRLIRQKNGSMTSAYGNTKRYAKKEWDSATPGQEYYDELCRVSQHQIIFGIDYVNWTGVGPGRIRWDKGMADGVSFNRYEVAYCSLIDHEVTIPLLWSGMRQAVSLDRPMTQQGNKKLNEKRIHPCHKPKLIYARFYLDYGFRGMRVIDTHVGGGSSREAAYDFGCEYVGSEIDPEYWAAQEKRFKEHTSHQSLFR